MLDQTRRGVDEARGQGRQGVWCSSPRSAAWSPCSTEVAHVECISRGLQERAAGVQGRGTEVLERGAELPNKNSGAKQRTGVQSYEEGHADRTTCIMQG